MSDKIASQIEEAHGRKLTNRQREFAKYYVEGIYSNAECARKAGFSAETAHVYASKLLAGKEHPQVLEYIKELREEKERRYGVTLIGQMQRLHQLSQGAEEAGQFSAAINAEKIRSALGGLTIDRRETINKLDDMSRADIVARLSELQKKYPHAFIEGEFKDVTGTGSQLLEHNAQESATELLRVEDREPSHSRDA
jgi:glutamate synthase domain-containing protein 2